MRIALVLFDSLFGGSSGRGSGSGSSDGSGRESGDGRNSYDSGSTRSKSRSSDRLQRPKSTSPGQSSPGQFQEDTQDGVNQDYFKPVSPSRDNYVQPIEEISPSVNEQQDQEKQQLKKQMNELDYTIKLKKIKKKKKKKK